MIHFRMELHGIDFPAGMLEGGYGICRFGRRAKAFRKAVNVVAMTIPNVQILRNLMEQFRFGWALA